MNPITKYLLLAFTAGVLFVSCSKGNSIVGKWREINGDNTTPEFFKDGTVRAMGSDGKVLEGTYSFVEHDRIKMELRCVGAHMGPTVLRVSISEDELSLTEGEGKVSRYKRVRD